MDFELSWLLLGLPIAFLLGWIASRMDLRQWRRENRDSPKPYFKGLNLLLNEQQDKAIDAFIEAVQNDPDTADLHFALGNLFRRRGEFERAVRVHEHLLSRSDLKTEDRHRAQHALAQDFLRAGLFDRAEDACLKLEGTAFEAEARLARLALHERSRDWEQAIAVCEQMEAAEPAQRLQQGSLRSRMAHYFCELALQADLENQPHQALSLLERARQCDPQAPRPLVLMGQQHMRQGDAAGAMHAWEMLSQVRPPSFALVAVDYAEAAQRLGGEAVSRAIACLEGWYAQSPSLSALKALRLLDGPAPEIASSRLLEHLKRVPASLSAAHMLLSLSSSSSSDPRLVAAQQSVARAARPLERYRCAACGFEAHQVFWQCPGCLNWDSFPPQTLEEL